MRRTDILLYISLATATAIPKPMHGQTTPLWQFQGLEVTENIGCVNSHVTKTASAWVLLNENSSGAKAKLEKMARDEYGRSIYIRPITISPKSSAVIALVRHKVDCGRGPARLVDSYRYYYGADQAAVLRKVEDHVASYNVKSFEVVEWIDAQQVAESLSFYLREPRAKVERPFNVIQVIKDMIREQVVEKDKPAAPLIYSTWGGRG